MSGAESRPGQARRGVLTGGMIEGLPPHRPTTILRLSTDQASARAMTELLGEVFDPAETAVASFETADGSWLLEAYFGVDPDEDAIRELLAGIVGEAAADARFEAIEARDWVRSSLEGLKPVRAGRVLVHGEHDRATVKPNDIGIEIEAALAFGTGHHGTTAGCLLALSDVAKEWGAAGAARRVLDVGTGTGILAIAAARTLHGEVVAGDIDPVAVTVARHNARANGAGDIRFYVGAGVDNEAVEGRFHLIFANILARPLRRLAPALAGKLGAGGQLVLSGLLASDVMGVLAAYRAQGLSLLRRRDLDGWATLVLTHGGAAPRRSA